MVRTGELNTGPYAIHTKRDKVKDGTKPCVVPQRLKRLKRGQRGDDFLGTVKNQGMKVG